MQVYMSRQEVAHAIGVSPDTLSRYKLPDADVVIGSGDRPVRGWLPETIEAWQASRPGPGRWGGR